jgi:hypothetical protein
VFGSPKQTHQVSLPGHWWLQNHGKPFAAIIAVQWTGGKYMGSEYKEISKVKGNTAICLEACPPLPTTPPNRVFLILRSGIYFCGSRFPCPRSRAHSDKRLCEGLGWDVGFRPPRRGQQASPRRRVDHTTVANRHSDLDMRVSRCVSVHADEDEPGTSYWQLHASAASVWRDIAVAFQCDGKVQHQTARVTTATPTQCSLLL